MYVHFDEWSILNENFYDFSSMAQILMETYDRL